jgi:tyrosine-protein kinase Tec
VFHIILQQRRKERGRVDIGSVQVVEPAQLSGSGASSAGGGGAGGGDNSLVLDGVPHPAGFPFQVGYQEGGQEYTLYLLANRDQDRAEWIRALRAGNQSILSHLTRMRRCSDLADAFYFYR